MTRRSWLGTAAAVFIPILVTLAVAGCNADQAGQTQDIAQDIQYVAGSTASPATTQPTDAHPKLDAARAVVQVAGQVYPPVKTIAGIVGLLAGAIAGIAGHLAGKRGQATDQKHRH